MEHHCNGRFPFPLVYCSDHTWIGNYIGECLVSWYFLSSLFKGPLRLRPNIIRVICCTPRPGQDSMSGLVLSLASSAFTPPPRALGKGSPLVYAHSLLLGLGWLDNPGENLLRPPQHGCLTHGLTPMRHHPWRPRKTCQGNNDVRFKSPIKIQIRVRSSIQTNEINRNGPHLQCSIQKTAIEIRVSLQVA